MSTMNGVYPVYDLKFKINTGTVLLPVLSEIEDMETFSMTIDNKMEEWTPINTEGWIKRLLTAKGFTLALNGKRNVGDVGNDFIANKAYASGKTCSANAEIEFPDGATLAFDCVIDVKTPFGGDSTNVSALEFELASDGKPVYTSAV